MPTRGGLWGGAEQRGAESRSLRQPEEETYGFRQVFQNEAGWSTFFAHAQAAAGPAMRVQLLPSYPTRAKGAVRHHATDANAAGLTGLGSVRTLDSASCRRRRADWTFTPSCQGRCSAATHRVRQLQGFKELSRPRSSTSTLRSERGSTRRRRAGRYVDPDGSGHRRLPSGSELQHPSCAERVARGSTPRIGSGSGVAESRLASRRRRFRGGARRRDLWSGLQSTSRIKAHTGSIEIFSVASLRFACRHGRFPMNKSSDGRRPYLERTRSSDPS